MRFKRLMASLVWGLTWIFLIIGSVFSQSKQQQGEQQTTEIEVNNPAPLGVQVEIKCDWKHEKQRFAFHDWVTIRRHSKKTVVVPYGMKHCQLWPKIVW